VDERAGIYRTVERRIHAEVVLRIADDERVVGVSVQIIQVIVVLAPVAGGLVDRAVDNALAEGGDVRALSATRSRAILTGVRPRMVGEAKTWTTIDRDYEQIRIIMQTLFDRLDRISPPPAQTAV